MTEPHSDLCSRCGLPFFTIHSPQNCIDALRARVRELERELRVERATQDAFAPLSNTPDVLESLEEAYKRGGFD